MADPYEILGVGRDATDDQIKQAYREKARKYHPDNYDGNPLSDLAAEKMQEINDAYDRVMNERRGGNTYFSGYEPQRDSNFKDIRALVSQGRLEEAQELLDGVPISRRDGEWHFLNGSVLYRRGWFDDAYASFCAACRHNPQNEESRAALNQLERQRRGGFGTGRG
ncbi:MAG: DnaJ domain-containing protein, partial [Oscillospiraceae bacterium]|nr:DnaJ domain-containing protein [Oscillospiraceae bacterium]